MNYQLPPADPELITTAISELARTTWDERNHLTWERPAGATRPVRSVALLFYALGIGGGERVTRFLVEQFLAMGYEVTLLTHVPPTDTAYVAQLPDGVEHVVLPDSEIMLDGASYAPRCERLTRVLADRRVDALVLCHWFYKTLAYDAMVAAALGIKTFLLVQSPCTMFFLDAQLRSEYLDAPLAYRSLDGIVCLSEMDGLFWRNFNDHVYRTMNPLSLDVPDEPAPLAGTTVIWPARMHYDKCPERVVPILEALLTRVPEARILMVGPVDEELAAAVQADAEARGVADHLVLCGPQPEHEMRGWYERADAFLMTSRREGWSLALGEALAMGLPCVMYDLPYLTLAQCDAVISVPQGDAEAAADALTAVLLDKGRARALGQQGRAFMTELSHYDYQGFWRSLFDDTDDVPGAIEVQTQGRTSLSDMLWDETLTTYRQNIATREAREQELYHGMHNALYQKALVEQELGAVRAILSDTQDLLAATRQSTSYRIGRAITAIPHAIKERLTGR